MPKDIHAGETEWNLVAKKTDIEFPLVYGERVYNFYNTAGYLDVLAPVMISEEEGSYIQYGLIGPDGKYLLPLKDIYGSPLYNTIGDQYLIFDDIICDTHQGYYTLAGEKAFDIDFYEEGAYVGTRRVLPFYNGKAVVQYIVEGNISPIYTIDTKGKILSETSCRGNFYYAGCGLYFYNTNDEDGNQFYAYYDYDGDLQFTLEDHPYASFAGTGVFCEGLAWVRNAQSRLVGFIDTTGNEVIPCMYREVDGFIGGISGVQDAESGDWGAIDMDNEIVIPFEYDMVYGGEDGLIMVKKDGKCGFVDSTNSVILPLEYDNLTSYRNGVAYGLKDGVLYVIKNSQGSVEVENATGSDKIDFSVEGNTVTVSSNVPCKLGYLSEGKYVSVPAKANDDGSYEFTAPDGVTEVVLVVKGDVTGDGAANLGDAARIKAAFRRKLELSALEIFAADVNSDGAANLGDAAQITASFRKKFTIAW
ncbi:MAG: WG repeat-containing protein [Firmicutes bacterium]|nr:WG repeat-containing protein [Bacillota bacterium]